MPHRSLWSRIRKSRLAQVLLVYAGASWLLIQVVGELRTMLQLPAWIGPVTVILLAVGLLILLATAWVQSHPLIEERERAEEVPGSWEVDVGDALRSLRSGRVPHLTWGRALIGGALVFGLVFGGAGVYVVLRGAPGVLGTGSVHAETAPDGVAVLPFTIRGAGIEDWREGMVDLLSTGLDGAGGLRAIASRTVLARWNEAVPEGRDVEESVAFDIARRTGARYALQGSAVAIGPRVRLVVDVHELEPTGTRRLGQAQVEGSPDSVLVLVDRLGMEALATMLRGSDTTLDAIDVASVTTSSLPALKHHLEGESLFRRGDFEGAAAAYERAVSIDTTFALAWWRLSQALGWNENVASARASAASRRASELMERLPSREAQLVRATTHLRNGDIEAVRLLEDAVRRYPDDAELWYQLADAYYHIESALVDPAEIEAAFERAVALAPRSAPYQIHPLQIAMLQHADSALTARRLARLEAVAPNSPYVQATRIALSVAFGDEAAWQAAADEVLRLPESMGSLVYGMLGHPRLVHRRASFGELGYASFGTNVKRSVANTLGWGFLWGRGQLRTALRWFRDPVLSPLQQANHIIETHLNGVPVPADLLDQAASQIELRGSDPFLVGALAAERGRWDDHAVAAATISARADSLRVAGDSVAARRLDGEVRLLEGFGLWRRGRGDEAVAVLEQGYLLTAREPGRWWIATIHMDAGRWHEAERYFLGYMRLDPDPLAAYYLGQIYEATGRLDRARAMFGFFVEQWADSDPEFQSLVRDARDRLARLAPDRSQ